MGLAEALVLSGLAMTVAGTSRPCSGACHEISHALDQLYLTRAALHGEQVGMGAVFASLLRGDEDTAQRIASCLHRHRLPVVPAQVGLTVDEYVEPCWRRPLRARGATPSSSTSTCRRTRPATGCTTTPSASHLRSTRSAVDGRDARCVTNGMLRARFALD